MKKHGEEDYWRGAERVTPGTLADMARMTSTLHSKEVISKIARHLELYPGRTGTVDLNKSDSDAR